MSQTKNRSIKMTDEQYNTVRKGALERHLPIGEFMKMICDKYDEKSYEPEPKLISSLLTVREIMQYPKEAWNEDIMKLFDSTVEEICTSLKW